MDDYSNNIDQNKVSVEELNEAHNQNDLLKSSTNEVLIIANQVLNENVDNGKKIETESLNNNELHVNGENSDDQQIVSTESNSNQIEKDLRNDLVNDVEEQQKSNGVIDTVNCGRETLAFSSSEEKVDLDKENPKISDEYENISEKKEQSENFEIRHDYDEKNYLPCNADRADMKIEIIENKNEKGTINILKGTELSENLRNEKETVVNNEMHMAVNQHEEEANVSIENKNDMKSINESKDANGREVSETEAEISNQVHKPIDENVSFTENKELFQHKINESNKKEICEMSDNNDGESHLSDNGSHVNMAVDTIENNKEDINDELKKGNELQKKHDVSINENDLIEKKENRKETEVNGDKNIINESETHRECDTATMETDQYKDKTNGNIDANFVSQEENIKIIKKFQNESEIASGNTRMNDFETNFSKNSEVSIEKNELFEPTNKKDVVTRQVHSSNNSLIKGKSLEAIESGLNYKKKSYLRNLRNETSDTKEYRNGYPNLKYDSTLKENIEFLKGKIDCVPRGDYIHNIHKNWRGDYNKLEVHHGYIQWIFPLRIQGVNYDAQPLQLHEIEELMNEENKMNTKYILLESYKMMLDFYGMKLTNAIDGELERSENYRERYDNLIWRSHNNLRITRILKCLGEFDMENYQIGFIDFLMHEIFETKELENLGESFTKFWIHTVKNDLKRKELISKAEEKIIFENKNNTCILDIC